MDIDEIVRTGNLVNYMLHMETEYPDKFTLLEYACKYGHLPIVQQLILHNPYLDVSHGFHQACQWNQLDIVEVLIKRHLGKGTLEDSLMIAVERQYHLIAEELLMHGADINTCIDNYVTPLLLSILNHDIRMIKLLLMYGANTTFKFNMYVNALRAAVIKGSPEIIRIILDTGNFMVGESSILTNVVLFRSAHTYIIMKLLLDFGYDPNEIPASIDTPLIAACKIGDINLCKLLLDYKANPNQTGYYHHSSLLHSIERNNLQVATLLLSYGADINSTNINNTGLLALTCLNKPLPIVQFLVDHGAHVGFVPLIYAIRGGNIDIVKYILQHGNHLHEYKVIKDTWPDTNSNVYQFMNKMMDMIPYTTLDKAMSFIETPHCMSNPLVDFPTWYALLPSSMKLEWSEFLKEGQQTARACYLAVYEEQDTMMRFRRGEEVEFSQSSLRQLMRPYGARPIRNRVVQYLVHPTLRLLRI